MFRDELLSRRISLSDYIAIGDKAPDAAHGYFIVNQNGVSWDADGSGAGAAVQLIQFQASSAEMTASAFSFF